MFFLNEKRPAFVAFICTGSSRANVNEICSQAAINQAESTQIFEVEDDAGKMGDFTAKCNEAYRWIKEKCGEGYEIVFNPTAGRKWMSTGLSMFANRTGCAVYYVDVDSENRKPIPGTERLVTLGSADDYAGFSECDKAVQLFNRLDFVGAYHIFQSLEPCGSAAARELYRGLAVMSDKLSEWERFEHYQNQEVDLTLSLEAALTQVNRSAEELRLPLRDFVAQVGHVLSRVRTVCEGAKPSLHAVTDLYFNACRRIEARRLDDGVARLYRTLEAMAQWLLSLRGLETSSVDWSKISDREKALYRERTKLEEHAQLPSELGLIKAMQLAACLNSVGVTQEVMGAFVERHQLDGVDMPEDLPLLAIVSTEVEFAIDWDSVPYETKQKYRRDTQHFDDDQMFDNISATPNASPKADFDHAFDYIAAQGPEPAPVPGHMIEPAPGGEEEGRLPAALGIIDALAVQPDHVRRVVDPFFNQQRQCVFERHLSSRNLSILAHGWNPVTLDVAEKFRDAVGMALRRLGAELDGWEVPKLPKLWS